MLVSARDLLRAPTSRRPALHTRLGAFLVGTLATTNSLETLQHARTHFAARTARWVVHTIRRTRDARTQCMLASARIAQRRSVAVPRSQESSHKISSRHSAVPASDAEGMQVHHTTTVRANAGSATCRTTSAECEHATRAFREPRGSQIDDVSDLPDCYGERRRTAGMSSSIARRVDSCAPDASQVATTRGLSASTGSDVTRRPTTIGSTRCRTLPYRGRGVALLGVLGGPWRARLSFPLVALRRRIDRVS